jgi:hexosaminidase
MHIGKRRSFHIWQFAALLIFQLILSACKPPEIPFETIVPNDAGEPLTPASTSEPVEAAAPERTALDNLIPKPVEVSAIQGVFVLESDANIYVAAGSAELEEIGQYLADRLSPATGYPMQVVSTTAVPANGNIYLTLDAGDAALGDEGYLLSVTSERVLLSANHPTGIFYAVQTLRQLLPPVIEANQVQPGPWTIPAAMIRDFPRFEWRGVMLDVARHFFSVEDVKRYIDLASYYKLNRFHMHLTDDQGWRIMIESWPDLAKIGGLTAVGGDPGGYYTQADYAEIIAYAQSRSMVVVPEIDMPGHTNAALASYPELNCDGIAPPPHTGIEVGFSSLCIQKEITYQFVDDVIRELAALTPGDYIHIGGDEAQATSDQDYRYFIERVQDIVAAHGKQMVGWEEIAQIDLLPTSIAQIWNNTMTEKAIQQDARLILSPAAKTYLDMKYNADSPLGLSWAAFIEVQDAYDWDPAQLSNKMSEDTVLGIEAPLWSETLRTIADVEYMAFPRLPGHAEIGWSPVEGRGWDEYRQRLASHGPRLEALEVNFYRSPQIPWE